MKLLSIALSLLAIACGNGAWSVPVPARIGTREPLLGSLRRLPLGLWSQVK